MFDFSEIKLRTSLSKDTLQIVSILDHPTSGKCWYGYLVDADGEKRYPIIEGVVKIIYNDKHSRGWMPDKTLESVNPTDYQEESTVDFFGFEWTLFPNVNNEKELYYRTRDRYKIDLDELKDKVILDAGCGCGDESKFFLDHGAKVVSVDLSDAIEVAARKLSSYKNSICFKADITNLPFDDEFFDFVYCEGVIQHTRSSSKTIEELVRVLKKGGHITAWHYTKGEKTRWYMKQFDKLREYRRKKFRMWDRHTFVAYTAFLASLGYIPIIGELLKKFKLISKKTQNRSFQANWAMTMDALGWHQYQRFCTKKEFQEYFDTCGSFSTVYDDPNAAIVHLIKK